MLSKSVVSITAILAMSFFVSGCNDKSNETTSDDSAKIVNETVAEVKSDGESVNVSADGVNVNTDDIQVNVNADGVQVGDIAIDKNGIEIPSVVSIKTGSESSTGEGGNVESSFQCSSDNPNAIVTGANREVTITGKCSSIKVDGSNLEVAAEQTDSLITSGVNNNIEISLVNSITVSGGNTNVSYDSNFDKNPAQVSVTGANSDVEQNE